MQNFKKYFILITILFFNIGAFCTDILYQDSNIVSADFFYSGIKNPASLNNFQAVSYSAFLKNSFTLSNFGVLIPFDDSVLGFGANDCNNGFYENSIILNHSFKGIATAGFSFNLLYDNLSSHNIYHNLNLGLFLNPFTKEFKKQGQYIEMFFVFYVNNLLNDDYIEDYFKIAYGGGLGINYNKDVLQMNIDVENTDKLNLCGNVKLKVIRHNYLFSSFDINGVSLGLRHEYKDLVFLFAFLRDKGKNSFQMGINYLSGNYNKVVVEDLMKLGLDQYRKKDYRSAKEYFMKVLLISKTNREAKQYLQIIDERLKLKIKGDVNRLVLHIMGLIKKKKMTLAKEEFTRLKKQYPEFEYKWKILYNKLGNSVTSKKNGVAKHVTSEKVAIYSKIKAILEEGNLKLALEEFNKLKVEDKKKYSQLGEDINNAVSNKKNELLKDADTLDEDHLIVIYEKILNEIDANDIHKKDVIHYYISKGEDLYRNKKYKEAIEMWNNVLKYDKDNSQALIYIKTTQKKIGDK